MNLYNNDLAGYGSGTKVAAKATSCTKSVSASKASSATSATYSSTANYSKNCCGLVFAKNSEGNWGYKPSGADTVIPFSDTNIADVTAQLYASLQYSTLVTEDMTFDEMCDALLNKYPEVHYLFFNGNNRGNFKFTNNYNLSYGTTSGYGGNTTLTMNDNLIFILNSTTGAGVNAAIVTDVYDLTNFNYITFKYTLSMPRNDNATQGTIFFSKSLGLPTTTTKIYIFHKAQLQTSGELSIDISSLSGQQYIGFNLALNQVNSTATFELEYIYLE